MFERYTEKARRVIFFSRHEASEFGSPYIESEFLLLGILREDKHVVLRWLGEGDWQTILRDEIAKRVYKGPRVSTSVDLPLSDDAKRVLGYAAEEAAFLSHHFIGVEHLFLGLLHDPKSRVAKMLFDRGVDASIVRKALAKETVESGSGIGSGSRSAVTRRSFQVVIVPEEGGQPLYPLWQSRPPAVGEVLTVNRDEGKPTVYEVVKVEWEVSSMQPEPPSLSKVLIRVRELRTV
jgi:ATP-dependent Clp protease ATP-binding subunit ClpA